MQHTNERAFGPRAEPAPIWVLIAGVVMLVVALGPQLAKPAHTSPVRPATTATPTPTAARGNGSGN
jgi:hypothetical protein